MEIDEKRRLEEAKRIKDDADEMHKQILSWLSSDDFEETHERHFKKRFKNTGQWLLDDPRFKNWRDGAQSSLLWCYGARKSQSYACKCNYINLSIPAGSGKTILAYEFIPA